MTSEPMSGTTSSTSTRTSRAHNGGETDPVATRGDIQAAVHEVRGALEEVGRQMPGMARASRNSVNDMLRAIEDGTDERIFAGVTLSLGLAIGMLVGGAPRLFILAALAPVAAMGLTVADRRTARTPTTSATRTA